MLAHLSGYQTGRLLVATPQIEDGRFYKSVIFVCGHDDQGAMGLVINRTIENLSLRDLLTQIGLNSRRISPTDIVYSGGPVEAGRGFVLHSADYENASTLRVVQDFAVTSTLEILSEIADGQGPRDMILALGYASWGAGQLEEEIHDNLWLQLEASEELVFRTASSQKWRHAMDTLGVDEVVQLSSEVGHA